MRTLHLSLLVLAAALGACQPPLSDNAEAPAAQQTQSSEPAAEIEAPDAPGAQAYDGIGENEIVRFTGTEPFWGGQVGAGEALYNTPENIDGTRFPVTRFAGNNGVSFSGTMDGAAFDLMITPGDCSDGMSDRTYPFVATLTIGGEQRNGCAWTERRSFTGPQNP